MNGRRILTLLLALSPLPLLAQEPSGVILRLHLDPVRLSGSGEVVLQDVWSVDDSVVVTDGNGQERFIPLESGFGMPDALASLEAEEGQVFTVRRNEEYAGTGAVKNGLLDISLTHLSSFILLDPARLGASKVELAALGAESPFDHRTLDLPAGGMLLSMAPDAENLALFSRDSTLRSTVLTPGEAGSCIAPGELPAPWSVLSSTVQATTWQTKNLSTGNGYKPGEYSGITPVGNDRYALVHNSAKGGGIHFATIPFIDGRIGSVRIEAAPGTAEAGNARDPEGITYMPSTGTLWVSGEKDQQILEYDLEGRPTGRRMAVPAGFAPADLSTGNGFESLSYSPGTGLMWTVTEEPLKRDADWFPAGEGRRILRLLALNGHSLQPERQLFYAMDAPKHIPAKGDTYVHGVSDLLALDDGMLLVMEREVYVPAYQSGDTPGMLRMLGTAVTHIKLYIVDPGSSREALLSKLLVKEFDTRFPSPVSLAFGADPVLANFEGMCLGPVLDGHPTVLLVNDSEKGRGNSYARLQDYVKVLVF